MVIASVNGEGCAIFAGGASISKNLIINGKIKSIGDVNLGNSSLVTSSSSALSSYSQTANVINSSSGTNSSVYSCVTPSNLEFNITLYVPVAVGQSGTPPTAPSSATTILSHNSVSGYVMRDGQYFCDLTVYSTQTLPYDSKQLSSTSSGSGNSTTLTVSFSTALSDFQSSYEVFLTPSFIVRQ